MAPTRAASLSRPGSRCYGQGRSQSRSIRSSQLNSLFSPPTSPIPEIVAGNGEMKAGSSQGSPLSSAPTSPLLLPEDAPAPATSSSFPSPSASSIFDEMQSYQCSSSPITSPVAARGSSSRKRQRTAQSSASQFGRVADSVAEEEEETISSPTVQRVRRMGARQTTLMSTSITAEDQGASHEERYIIDGSPEAGPSVWTSPPGSANCTRQLALEAQAIREQKAAQDRRAATASTQFARQSSSQRSRGFTPSTSSDSLAVLLTASQSRPIPPKDHPGRSLAHAAERIEQQPRLLKRDGTLTELDAQHLPVLALDEEEEEDSEDVVFELLRGYRRKRAGEASDRRAPSPPSPDEIAAFFNPPPLQEDPANANRRSSSTTSRERSYTSSSDPQQERLRRSSSHDYRLPSTDLPATSSYARTKREEASPTPEIRFVKSGRALDREQRAIKERLAVVAREARARRSARRAY